MLYYICKKEDQRVESWVLKMMFTTREIEKRNQYGKICRYLETVFKNNLYGYNIIELCEYDITMPAEIKE